MPVFNGTNGDDNLVGGPGADTLIGGLGSDTLNGAGGNDLLNPGDNDEGYDLIIGSAGNDTITYADSGDMDFHETTYTQLGVAGPINANLNGQTGSGTVVKPNGTDTFLNVGNAMDYGMGLHGTNGNDTVTAVSTGYIQINTGPGNDVLNLTAANGTIRLLANYFAESSGPTEAFEVDLAAGVISQDGYGGSDTLNITYDGGRIELRGTDFADTLRGDDNDNRFILEEGVGDIADGRGGYDVVRYDRNGVESVNVNLATGTATGTWDGNAFSHTLLNIEEVWGSRDGDDVLRDSDGRNRLEGRGGNDSLYGGNGRDTLDGGDGDDLLDASAGTPESQGDGDHTRPGLGTDTIIGSEDLWNSGEGTDLQYMNIEGTGGLTFNIDLNGSGTVTSVNGNVNDNFTFMNWFLGSADGDVFNGSDVDRFQGYAGRDGADTINGGDGFDRVHYDFEIEDLGGGTGINANFNTGQIVDTQGNIDVITGIESIRGSTANDIITASELTSRVDLRGEEGDDRITGGLANDELYGGEGRDTLIGGNGNDYIEGGSSEDDLRDVVFGGEGNDDIDGGYGNDELRGDAGNDTIAGGFGVDTVIGGAGNDVMTGSAFSDLVFGGDGDDFVNGGFGSDRINGGDGADRFFHIGVAGHGSDWIQDFDNAEGDVLLYGGNATINQFQVNVANTANAGDAERR